MEHNDLSPTETPAATADADTGTRTENGRARRRRHTPRANRPAEASVENTAPAESVAAEAAPPAAEPPTTPRAGRSRRGRPKNPAPATEPAAADATPEPPPARPERNRGTEVALPSAPHQALSAPSAATPDQAPADATTRPARRYRFDPRPPVNVAPAAPPPVAPPAPATPRLPTGPLSTIWTNRPETETPPARPAATSEPAESASATIISMPFTTPALAPLPTRGRFGAPRRTLAQTTIPPTPEPPATEERAPESSAAPIAAPRLPLNARPVAEPPTPSVEPTETPAGDDAERAGRRRRRRRGSGNGNGTGTAITAPAEAPVDDERAPLATRQAPTAPPPATPYGSPEPSAARGFGALPRGVASEYRTAVAPTPRTTRTDNGAPISPNHLATVITTAIQQQTDRFLAEQRRSASASMFTIAFPSTERVGVFVDVANLVFSMQSMRIPIDFGRLLAFLRGDRRLIRAHAYAPTSPEPFADQQFLQAVKGLGYRITTKDYKTFRSGAKKADLDLDLCMDIVRIVDAGAVDTIVLVSGDSDFLPLLEYCSDKGVRVEVAAFDESTAAILRQSCDLYINLSLVEDIRA